jgi:hypothetical protein
MRDTVALFPWNSQESHKNCLAQRSNRPADPIQNAPSTGPKGNGRNEGVLSIPTAAVMGVVGQHSVSIPHFF